jgi:aspartate/methionine/tyrosine aminotransferase
MTLTTVRAVSPLVQAIPAHGTRAIAAAAAGYEGVINLTLGEPDFATPPHIAEAGEGAFYALADVSAAGTDATSPARALAARAGGVACAPGDSFGPGAAGMLRVSLAAPAEAIEEGVRRIGRAVRESRERFGR